MTDSVRVLVIDDHPLIRVGIRGALEAQDGLTAAGECESLAAARAWLGHHPAPHAVILDRSLPDGDGLELVAELKSLGCKIIVLTIEDDDAEIRAAVEAGVDGYLLKSSDTDQILSAIQIVLNDAGAFPPHVLQKLARSAEKDPLKVLSSREMEIAEHVARGYSNKVIGAKLNLSDNTVRNHLANIMQKLNFHNRVQVATLVLQHLRRRKAWDA